MISVCFCCFCAVAKSCPTLQPQGLQSSKHPCPVLSPGVCSNSWPLSRWCHPIISSSATPLFFCLHSTSIRIFSNESVLPIRWEKCWSFSFSITPPMNIQDWFPLGLTALISLQFKGLLKVFSNTTVQKHQFFGAYPSLLSHSHIHTWLLEKPYLWLYRRWSAK